MNRRELPTPFEDERGIDVPHDATGEQWTRLSGDGAQTLDAVGANALASRLSDTRLICTCSASARCSRRSSLLDHPGLRHEPSSNRGTPVHRIAISERHRSAAACVDEDAGRYKIDLDPDERSVIGESKKFGLSAVGRINGVDRPG